jgi:transposase
LNKVAERDKKVDKILQMSTKELNRLEILQKLEEKRMRQKEAARILGVSVRHVKRLLKSYRRDGAQGLVSKRRGRPSNNRLSEETRQKALGLLKSKYTGFGPTLACEKLVEVEELQISKERLRQLMIAEGLWKRRKARKAIVHQMRARRAC